MIKQQYNVLVDGDIVAEHLALDIALILVGAMFEKYHAQVTEVGMSITIQGLAEGGPV